MLPHHEKKIIGLTALAFLCLLALIGAVIIPTIQRITELNTQIFSIQHDLELRYERTTNIRKSLTHLARIKQLASDLQKLFVQPQHELEFILFLENTAEARGLTQHISLEGATDLKETDLREIKTAMQVTGDFHRIMNYLHDLEHSPLALSIRSIELSRGGPEGISPETKSNDVTLSAEVSSYVQP